MWMIYWNTRLRVRVALKTNSQELKRIDVEKIEERRPMNRDMDAVYILSSLPHIVDCLMADFERRRYRRSFLIWTSGGLKSSSRIFVLGKVY